jgi:hypothetical protein
MTETETKELVAALLKGKTKLQNITNGQWGEVFTYLKNEYSPTTAVHMSKGTLNNRVIQRNWGLSRGDGDGTTSLYSRYCDNINNILWNIRQKRKREPVVDTVYKLHSVIDLLRCEPRLMSRLSDEYGIIHINVWIYQECCSV